MNIIRRENSVLKNFTHLYFQGKNKILNAVSFSSAEKEHLLRLLFFSM